MRVGLAALIVFAALHTELPRARADEDTASPILIHPRVVTVLQLPDEIVHTWLDHHGEIRVARIRDRLYIRPRPGTPAGVEASLEVETRTLHRTFQLRVVARARDANRVIQVPPVDAPAPDESPPEVPAAPEAPPLPVTPESAEPAASAPTSAASPAPAAALAPAEPPAEPSAERDTAASPERDSAPAELHPVADSEARSQAVGRSRLDLAAHAVAGMGFTGVNLVGYEPQIALQRHQSLGLRLTAEPRDSWWAVQADVNAEWPAGPMVYEGWVSTLEMSGPRLRLEMGMRASVGTEWTASVYVGIGIQMHLRRIEETVGGSQSTLQQGGVLALGLGLQYRTRGKVLLGLDFLVRQGGPDDYHSAAALLTVGRFLNQGD